MRHKIIEAVIIRGPAMGKVTIVFRIRMIPANLPFQNKRLRFPVKITYALALNKSQEQTY